MIVLNYYIFFVYKAINSLKRKQNMTKTFLDQPEYINIPR